MVWNTWLITVIRVRPFKALLNCSMICSWFPRPQKVAVLEPKMGSTAKNGRMEENLKDWYQKDEQEILKELHVTKEWLSAGLAAMAALTLIALLLTHETKHQAL